MIPAIIASIAGMLAKQGLGLLSDAVNGAGEKAVEFIEEKTGIKLTTDGGQQVTALSPEQVLAMESLQSNERITLGQLALENKKEDHRHIEASQSATLADVGDARNRQVQVEKATGKRDMNLYILAYLFVGGYFLTIIIMVAGIAAGKVPSDIPQAAVMLLGSLFGTLGAAVGAVVQYFFGSSMSSAQKTEIIAKGAKQ
ncbi:MAG: hypothetical protein ABIL58_23195 [Pseudomonadota bacterium]